MGFENQRLLVYGVIIKQVNNRPGMPLAQQHLNQAQIFLCSYRDAMQVLKQTARSDRIKHDYQNFLSQVIATQNSNSEPTALLSRKIKLFQFSHYYFVKHFPELAQSELKYEEFLRAIGKNAGAK